VSIGRCPICAGTLRRTRVRAFDRLVTGDGPFEVLECAACGCGVTDVALDDDALGRYYDRLAYYGDYYHHQETMAGGALRRARERSRRVAARRRLRRPPFAPAPGASGRVLDVGCGAGELLAGYHALGWATFGVDPAAESVAAAQQRGATVHRGTLADVPWPAGSFELVTFSHSLEHIPEPVATLRRAASLLVPGGRIAIEVPNWACWQRRLFDGRWFHLDLPRHVQHFSPRSLRRLADELGLEVEAIGTRSMLISAAYSIHYLIAGRWEEGWRLWVAYALGLLAFPAIWVGDRLAGGDCAWAVLRLP
jgi:SAM-dependent methyltransferase